MKHNSILSKLNRLKCISVTVLALFAFVSGLAQTNYYSKSTGDLNALSTWGTNTNGSGTAPTSFTAANQLFNIRNNAAPSISANWAVSGTGSKVILGNGTTAISFTIPAAYTFSGTIDLSANATLVLQNSTLPTFGTINAASTVNYASSGTQTIAAINYGNLSSSSTGARILSSSGTIGIAGNFTPGTNTYTVTGSTVSFNGSTAQTMGVPTVASGANYNNVIIENSGVTTGNNFPGYVLMAGAMTIGGDMTIQKGFFFQGAATDTSINNSLTINGNLSLNGGSYDFVSSNIISNGNQYKKHKTLYLKGNLVENSASSVIQTSLGNAWNGAINFCGTYPQTISFANPTTNNKYVNFDISNTAGVMLLSNISISGYSNIENGAYQGTLTVYNNAYLYLGSYTITQNTLGQATSNAVFNLLSGASVETTHTGGLESNVPATTMTRNINDTVNYIFSGTALQSTGFINSPAKANSITINNANNVTLDDSTSVLSSLNFTAGKFNIQNYVLTIGSSATINGYDNSKYIIVGSGTGRLKRSGLVASVPAVYPVGPNSSRYMPATITTNVNNLGDFAVNVVLNATLEGTVGGTPWPTPANIVNAMWNVDRITSNVGGPVPAVTVKLDWNSNSDIEGSYFSTLTNSLIGVWSRSSAITWIPSAPSSLSDNANNISSAIGAASFNTQFVVGRIDGILPLAILSAKAERNGRVNQLSWKAENANSSDWFEVERSYDGSFFERIATVFATAATTYSYNDAAAADKQVYYRIKLVAGNGITQFSSVMKLTSLLPTEVQVVSSMVTNMLVLKHPAGQQSYCRIISQNGQVLKSVKLIDGSSITYIDAGNLRTGVYFAEYLSNKEKQTVRFIKQ